ncbi:DUF429 domain-containing protein [Halobium palmae]|uniref:DUF429 domain-containing protein n=1 Tax=Halobium palmae TaxID=1776492 RepID=A0ABD5RZC8_9EURY
MTRFDTIYGVDFAVAKDDADRKLWIAKADADEDGLSVTKLQCARDFLRPGPRGREDTLTALHERIVASDESAAWGLDFPFGVPKDLIQDGCEWREMVETFPEKLELGGNERSPDGLYEAAKTAGEGGEKVDARAVDGDGAQPAAGWFMKYLTYHGIESVLKPIVERSSATVVPMDSPSQGESATRPVVLEVYPDGTLRDLEKNYGDATSDRYKGVTDSNLRNRYGNLEALEGRSVGFDSDDHEFDLRERAAHNDDALDAVVAAYATWQHVCGIDAAEEYDFKSPERDSPDIEGYIYT